MKFAFLAAAVALGFVPAAANATLQLKISDGSATQILTDTNNVGFLNFTGTIGGFAIVVSTGVDEQRLGTSSTPAIDLNSIQVSGQTKDTLAISLTETGITNSGSATFDSQIGGTQKGSTLTYATYVDATNQAFGTTTLVGSQAITTSYFAGEFDKAINPGKLYSMTEVVTVAANGASTSSFDAQLMSVPEPMSLTILGAGLVALGGVRRRRQSAIPG